MVGIVTTHNSRSKSAPVSLTQLTHQSSKFCEPTIIVYVQARLRARSIMCKRVRIQAMTRLLLAFGLYDFATGTFTKIADATGEKALL